jgi:hypothetical protein
MKKSQLFRRPHMRLGLSISIIMAVGAAAAMAFMLANRSLFSANSHFTIRNIAIRGTASWKAREAQILQYGRIRKGESNLFAINPRELRERISALPSVEKASVSRKLPDTLVISISERVPRVAFNNSGRRWYSDEHGVVFSASSYGELRQDMPIIVGFSAPEALAEGDSVEDFIFPAAISITASRYFPEFIVLRIDIRERKFVIAKIRPADSFDVYTVVFPMEDIEEKFAAFKWALRRSIEEQTGKTTFDLRFAGQVVTR